MSGLAPYAADEAQSRGRRHHEAAARYRGEYQRDRDRIIHSTAFRRLVYKTQVFVNHEGDLYRTRLTHSLEVAQIGRSTAVALNLNEPLIEAICLAHDLGHTPFGHAGQDELNSCMRDFGGFEHNLQSLRVVDELEAKYAEFPGLNLMFETREGILKHCSKTNARELGDVGERFLSREQPGLEAQIANIADAIAYNNHDVDDGFRAGLLSLDQLREQSLLTTQDNINAVAPGTIDDVRKAGKPLVAFSDEIYEQHVALKRFLSEHLYKHEKKLEMTHTAQAIIRELFELYMSDLAKMPAEFADRSAGADETGRARVVADYVAGMTDRFAIAEHERLIGKT